MNMIKTGGTCLALVLLMSSCYTVTHTVGTGSQGTEIVKKKNHYLIGGLAPLKVADTKEMANGKANYDITVTHTFVDGLIGAITFGLYSPTTTIVKK